MTVPDLVIKNGKLVLSEGVIEAGVVIDHGKIVGIANEVNLPQQAESVIDAKGKLVMPGLIDPHVHLRERKFSFAHNLKTESSSAATGGITTLINYLWDSNSYLGVIEGYKKDIANNSLVDIAFHALLVSESHLKEIPDYRRLGISSFKLLMGYKGEEAKKVGLNTSTDDGYLYEAFERISALKDGVAVVHAENADLADRLCSKLVKSKDHLLTQWYDARPPICEEEAISRAIFFARKTNCPICIAHVSSAAGVEALESLKAKNVYAETCPHYLSLTKNNELGIRGKVNPPLREKRDVDSLWRAIENGLIDTVGSDHAAHTIETKGTDFWKSPPGWTGTAAILPLLLTNGVKQRRIAINRIVEVCSTNPSKIFGLYPRKGCLLVGSDADIAIVDFQKTKRVTPEILNSVSDYTPYEGMELQGWPTITLKGGIKVMEEGQIIEKVTGKYLSR